MIPRRSNQKPEDKRHRFDKDVYRRRAVVEQCVGRLKESRAVGTRFDKLTVNYTATVKLAMIRPYLRKLSIGRYGGASIRTTFNGWLTYSNRSPLTPALETFSRSGMPQTLTHRATR